ncbi:hypothetical protein [Persicitalea jodogahamensis]|uniref:Uncharacterized protein n=1 Tax=Persicitalea jodogahamensis TaxID=402147 RepID=A0A8J3G8J4_9BACT|nr:hypothetical protein [Persicitalea jodogahamensis]GHB55611.1 hypothetical protein GCM10007390_06030 [Persicitalea jodogahamensis]
MMISQPFYVDPYLLEYFGLVLLLLVLFGASFAHDKASFLTKSLGLGVVVLPILYFYVIIDAHLVNIPFTDDFVLLETVRDFRQEQDFVAAVKILFAQVNQHRFAFERLVMLALVFITGTVNIKVLITLGNLFLLGILYLFALTFRDERVAWYYFLPIPFVLFNLTFYENAFWGIAAIQNTPLLFFAFLSAYSLGRANRAGLWVGAISALIVTFVSGTGMLAWIIGAVILVFQKRYRSLLWWSMLAIGSIAFYFLFDYQFIASANAPKPWEHPIFNGLLLLGFVGNSLYLDIPHPMQQDFYPDMMASVYLGIFIGVVFLGWLIRSLLSQKLKASYWFVLGAFLFGLGTGAMFVLSRPMGQFFMYGGSIFSRRYMIFGAVLLAVAYVALVVLTRRLRYIQPVVLVLGLLGFVALNFQSYFSSIVHLRQQHDELLLDGYYWKNYTTFLTDGDNFGDKPFWNHPTRMKELVGAIETSGLSNLYASDKLPSPAQLRAQTKDKSALYKGTFAARAGYRMAENNFPAEYIEFESQSKDTVYSACFLLVSDRHILPLPAIPAPYAWEEFLKHKTYYSAKNQYGLFRGKLPSGKFQIWIMSPEPVSDKHWDLRYTTKIVRLAEK